MWSDLLSRRLNGVAWWQQVERGDGLRSWNKAARKINCWIMIPASNTVVNRVKPLEAVPRLSPTRRKLIDGIRCLPGASCMARFRRFGQQMCVPRVVFIGQQHFKTKAANDLNELGYGLLVTIGQLSSWMCLTVGVSVFTNRLRQSRPRGAQQNKSTTK